MLASQEVKRFKNRPRLPRTAGLRTLSEMTAKLAAAGLDPSKIKERAEILAKAQGAERKRKRDEAEGAMDVDAERDGDEGDWMDVDGDEAEGTPKKRRKSDSGAVAVRKKRVPASNRQLSGMRDATVRLLIPCSPWPISDRSHSKLRKLFSYEIFHKGSAIARQRPARATVQSKQKWFVVIPCRLT